MYMDPAVLRTRGPVWALVIFLQLFIVEAQQTTQKLGQKIVLNVISKCRTGLCSQLARF